jgi:hypothetical protein
MELIREIAGTSVPAIVVGLFAGLWLAREGGYWIGRRMAARSGGQT